MRSLVKFETLWNRLLRSSCRFLSIKITAFIMICLLVFSIMLFTNSIGIVRVTSGSMEPTICTGDILITFRNILLHRYRPLGAQVDDVLLFSPFKQVKTPFIKRVKKIIFENNEKYYYVLGDNHSKSLDSRDFGLIPQEFGRGLVLTQIFRHNCEAAPRDSSAKRMTDWLRSPRSNLSILSPPSLPEYGSKITQ